MKYSFLIIQFVIFIRCSIKAKEFFCNQLAPCGCSEYDVITTRIIGGEPVVNHSWGWAVSLRVDEELHFCGGTILSSQFILTAAHCVDDPEIVDFHLKAAVGTDTLTDRDGQRIAVAKIFLHPQWTSSTNENDIALLKLEKPIDFNDKSIARICFPAIDTFGREFPDIKSSLVAIGWGYTTPSGNTSNILEQVTLEAIDSHDLRCNQSIHNVTIQFCAGVDGGGKGKRKDYCNRFKYCFSLSLSLSDTCEGDSGGPLMYYSQNYRQWLIAGITSYGDGCGKSDHAGIYTRISMYIDWIESITGKDGIVIVGNENIASSIRSNFILITIYLLLHFTLYSINRSS